MSEAVITLKGIQKSYGKHQVLEEINLQVNKGDIYGLVGKNGSGKTTIFKVILGLSEYNGGEIVINGRHQKYADCEQAFLSEAGRYVVKSISAKGDSLVVELTEKTVVQNDLNAEWVKSQEQEAGETISFF